MASTSAKAAYEGGAGGKFRKRASRIPATPYARPPARKAFAECIQVAKDFIKSNVSDPASKVIARTAHNLFSTLYRKRLTASSPDTPRVEREEVQQADTITQSIDPRVQVQVSSEQDIPGVGRSSKGINEIEEVLMKKTFTRAEVDRLTELLQSKTVNVPADDKRRPEPTPSRTEATHEFQRHMYSLQANKVESQRSLGGIEAAAANSSVLESDVASAADLGKAYMVTAPLNASPSNLGLRSQPFRKDALLANVPYTPKSTGALLSPNSAANVSANGYTMRRTHGRSAIYNMARTPNSRIHDTGIRKIDGFVASSSQWLCENSILSNGKQAMKRRSSILDSDIGSIGPIRRVRQKTDMMSSKNSNTLSIRGLSHSGKLGGFDIAQGSKSVRQKQMFLNGSTGNTSNTHLAANGDNSNLESTSVPSRSSEIAEKILQQLEKSVPSPKEKLSVLKLAVAREKTPSKLTHNMLNGKALRSLEDIDSPKLLKDDTFDVSNGKQILLEARASTSYKQDEFDNGSHMLKASSNKLAPKENGEVKAWKTDVDTVKTLDSADSSLAAGPSEKKRTFRMSAHEDFLELDDDSDSGGADPTAVKGKLDISAVDTKAVAAEPVIIAENRSPETKSFTTMSFAKKETKLPKSSEVKEGTDTKVNTVSTIAEKDASFTFAVPPASSTITQLTSPTPQAPLFSNGASPPKETPTQIFSSASKSENKAGPFKFSPQPMDSPFDAKSEPKLTSAANVAVPVLVTDTPQLPKLDENSKSQKSRELFGRPESSVPSTASTSATTNIFGSGPSTEIPKFGNGPFSVPSQVSNGSSNVIFSVSTTTTSTVAPTTTTTTTDSITSPKPSITPPAFPQLKFGSNSIATPPEQKDKAASPPPFGGSISIPSFGASSSSGLSTSSNMFGLGASSTTSSTSNLFSSSTTPNPFGTSTGASTTPNPFGTSTGASTTPNLFGTSTGPSTTPNLFGTSTGASTTPNPFATSTGASTTPNPFGTSSTPNPFSTSTGSLFGSTKTEGATVTPTFPTFGQSTSSFSSLSSGTTTFGSTPTPTPNVFGSTPTPNIFGSSSSTTPSTFGSGFGSTPSTSGFQFGAPSTTSAPATTSTPIFGSSSGFSFTSTAPTSSSPSPSPFGTPTPAPAFPFSAPPNSQINNMEDSMAEDTMQSPNPVTPSFGQPSSTPPPSNILFGIAAPSVGASPFTFGGQQQNLGGGAPLQSPSPFQATGNLEFSAGSSFSLGTSGGGDKANRKIFRAKRDKSRRK